MPEGVSGLLDAPARVANLPPILVASSVLQAVPPWQFRGQPAGGSAPVLSTKWCPFPGRKWKRAPKSPRSSGP